MKDQTRSGIIPIAILGGILVAAILVLGTIWTGNRASQDSQAAVRAVSLLYLDELAGRREQVVADNLQENVDVINIAVGLMTPEDLASMESLQAYQARMKQLFHLERFAFVDDQGLIYTSLGPETDIQQYQFDYQTISRPEISIKNLRSADKKVVIAVPLDAIAFLGRTLRVCFMEIDMSVMLQGVSMQAQEEGVTFCNIYTSDGVALSNTVLGGLAEEDNLLEAMARAEYEPGYSLEKMVSDFTQGNRGVVSFTYNGIRETLSYVPVEGADWLLTYLIRESVISQQIGSVTGGIIRRSVIQSLLTALVLLALFAVIIRQTRRSARIALEKETAEAESRGKQQELEQRLRLQEQLLEQERQRAQQDQLISALAADYWSVYYLDLDRDEGICYQAHADLDSGFAPGERFSYLPAVTAYCNAYVTEPYREEFLRFIQPQTIREGLARDRVISYRYVVSRRGREAYEMIRFAGVEQEGEDGHISAVGACLTDVDQETRRTLAQNAALSEALNQAQEANRTKTAFLSNMSHEIRTPMNAIIGLDNIALNQKDLPETTRGYLEQIGSSAQHLLNLINDILDMSRIESGRMSLKNEEFSFPRLLEAVNTMFSGQCQDKGLDYQCHILGQVDDRYIGDDMKLRQVLINILGNAVKFTPEGGRVALTVERTAQYEGKSTLRFAICDTGIGMSEDFLPRLFDTFTQEDSSTTSRYGSSGLGMAITKNLVELMNGTIQVQSEKGAGTTFYVTVTLSDAAGRDPDPELSLRPQDLTVLVVDDDPIALEHAQIILGQIGIVCDVAASGPEGLEMVKLHHARRTDYDLILIDWRMPEMDGVETTRQIRSLVGNDTPIIILTSFNWDDIAEEAKAAGVDTFVAKPLFAGSVMDEFREAFRRKNELLERKTADLKGKRVLLAEDVAINAEIILMVLSMREMEADLAENGRVAVELFESHAPGYYDAILMDMRMPEMDGLEATRHIRSMDRSDAKTVPIIALTANAFDEDVQRSMQAGLNAHLSKPVEPDALFETLEALI